MTGCVAFAGGGTGGHIYPALAIAEHLARPVHVLASTRAIDAEILRASGAAFTPIAAKPLGVSPRVLAAFARSWPLAVRQSGRVLDELASAHGSVEVVAMGGFVAPPVARAARKRGMPVTLVNLDAVPGRANRLVARWSHRVVSALPTSGLGPSVRVVGPIVRAAARAPASAADCRVRLGLAPDRPVLLVTGASQGAGTINDFLAAFARARRDALAGWQVLHQVGPGRDGMSLQAAYDGAGVPARVVGYLDEMGLAWGAAELAVSRAGAGSVAEAQANGVPSLFLPYPFHRDQHQRANAEAMTAAGAAVIETDRIDPEANLQGVGETLASLLTDGRRREAMRRAAGELASADGANTIAAMLEQG